MNVFQKSADAFAAQVRAQLPRPACETCDRCERHVRTVDMPGAHGVRMVLTLTCAGDCPEDVTEDETDAPDMEPNDAWRRKERR